MANNKRHWNPELIIKAIQARKIAGDPLNAQAVMTSDGGLWAAGRRYFGSWSRALDAAGWSVQQVKTDTKRRPRGFWSPERIITSIHIYHQKESRLDAYAMQRQDNALVAAATYYFGSWANALAAAGLDPEVVRRTIRRTPEQVLTAIQEVLTNGGDLGDRSMRSQNRALYGAAQSVFGSWRKAVTLAQGNRLDQTRTPF